MILYSEWDGSEGGYIVSSLDEDMCISERRSEAFLFAGDAIRITANGRLHLMSVDENWMLDRFRTFITFRCKDFKDMITQEFNGEAYFLQRIGPFGSARYIRRLPSCALYADGAQQEQLNSFPDAKLTRMANISCKVDELAVVHIGRLSDPSPSVVICFDLRRRQAIVIKALWRNTKIHEDGKYEVDVIFDNSEDSIPKAGNFVWFLIFPRSIEKVQVQLNNFCNFFVERKTKCL